MLIFWVLCLFQEVDLLLNDGSKNINVVEWRKTGLLASRVELSRRQSRRSLLMALTLAVTPDQKVHPEHHFLLFFDVRLSAFHLSQIINIIGLLKVHGSEVCSMNCCSRHIDILAC